MHMSAEIGQRAPEFTLKDETGETVSLSQYRGKNVVLVFYPLDFSSTCTRELQQLTATATSYDAANAEVIGISVDSHHAHGAFKRDEHLAAHLLADFHPKGAVATQYGVYLPEFGFANRATFIIDRDGVIQQKVMTSPGEARNADEYLQALAACPV
jgi:peroxiredoxin